MHIRPKKKTRESALQKSKREENKQHKFKRNDNLNSIKLTHQLQAH